MGRDENADYSKPLHPNPADHGFDYYFGIPASLDMDPYLYFENDRAVEKPTSNTAGQTEPRGVFWRPGPISPHFEIPEVLPTLTTKAISILKERAAKPEQPFFLYFPMPLLAYMVYGETVAGTIEQNLTIDWIKTTVMVLITGHVLFAFFIVINPFSQDIERIAKIPLGIFHIKY